MADLRQPRLTIRTPDGAETEVKAYTLQSEWLQPTDTWSATVYGDDPRKLRDRFRPLQPVEISLDGHTQLMGRIDTISGSGTGQLEISGRDYLADIVAGHVDPTLKVTDKQNLQTVILAALRPYGIDRTAGDFNGARNILTGFNPFVGEPERDFKKAKLSEFKPGLGMGAFDFCNRLAARHGFTVQQAFDRRTVAIVEPEYRQKPIGKLSNPGAIIRGSCRRDYSQVPTVVVARGRSGGSKAGKTLAPMYKSIPAFGDGSPTEIGSRPEVRRIISDDKGVSRVVLERIKKDDPVDFGNTSAPLYRPLYYEDKDSRNQEQLDRGIRRVLAEKLKDTLTYDATLRGHRDPGTGAIYSVDTVVSITDEIEGVEEDMWVMGRVLTNTGSGPVTRLRLIRLGALTL